MKTILQKINFTGIKRGREIALLLALSLFAIFDVVGQTATLATGHNGPWTNINKIGWTQGGITNNSTNLTNTSLPDDSNGSRTGSASFSTAEGFIRIDFSTAPGQLSFLTNTTFNATFTGDFVVEESATPGGTYTTALTILTQPSVSSTGATIRTVVPLATTRSIRFRLISKTGTAPLLVDQILLRERAVESEIDIFVGGNVIPSGSTSNFSTRNINTSSAPRVFTIVNNGSSTLTLNSFGLTNTLGNAFKITAAPSVSSLEIGEQTTFEVVFNPTSIGSKSGTVTIGNNDPNENPYIINLAGNATVLAPTISDFTPKQGTIGTTVTITGTNLINTTAVAFNGLAASSYKIISDTELSAVVPTNATTGKITVAVGTATASTATDFVVLAAPTISFISPTSGPVGTLVTVTGTNLDNLESVTINGGVAPVTNASSTELTAEVPATASLGLGQLVVTTQFGSASAAFTVTVPAPVITSVEPDSGQVGTLVIINGTNLDNLQSITFNGTPATNFEGTSTMIEVIVPEGTATGEGLLIVTTTSGTAQTPFKVLVTPTLDSFTPESGPVGTFVTVTGTNIPQESFLYFTDINGGYSPADAITVNAEGTEISGFVPSIAATGKLAIDNVEGTIIAETSTFFTVTLPAPTIDSLSANSGKPGDFIYIFGTNFVDVDSVTLNGMLTNFVALSADSIQFQIPLGATSGPLKIFTPGGIADTVFNVTPTLDSFTPESGPVGTFVTVTGTNIPQESFLYFTDINGNYSPADAITVNAEGTEISGFVPSIAATGKLAIDNVEGTIIAETTTFFTVTLPAPTIDSLSTNKGKPGDFVYIFGTNFVDVDSVTLNGVITNFVALSSDSIQFQVPSGATSGLLQVFTPGGMAQDTFYVAPNISSVDPNTARETESITIFGTNLKDVISVTFNGVQASFIDDNDGTSMTTTVPRGAAAAGPGFMVVNTLGGSDSLAVGVLEPTPLPVTLVSFTAAASSKGNTLAWETATEIDNAYFEVQSTTDLKAGTFATVSKVDSKTTNSTTLTSYKTVDANPAPGVTTYYRLKQVDLDGSFEFSKVVSVDAITTALAKKHSVKVYPNPFFTTTSVEVEAEDAGTLHVTLYYVTGKKAFEKTVEVTQGVNTINLELGQNYSSGMYILSTELNGTVITTRVIKQ